MREQKTLKDFGDFLLENYSINSHNNYVYIKNIHFTYLIQYERKNKALYGSVILDNGEEYGIYLSVNQEVIDKISDKTSINLKDWINSQHYGIPLFIQDTIVFSFRGELQNLERAQNPETRQIQIPFKVYDFRIEAFLETVLDKSSRYLSHHTKEDNDSFTTLPRYYLQKSWLDNWFIRKLNKNPRVWKVPERYLSTWMDMQHEKNKDASIKYKERAHEDYLSLGFSEKDSVYMSSS